MLPKWRQRHHVELLEERWLPAPLLYHPEANNRVEGDGSLRAAPAPATSRQDGVLSTRDVLIQVVGQRFFRARKTEQVTLSVSNVGTTTYDGPFWLLLEHVPSQVVWQQQQPDGVRAYPRVLVLPETQLNPGDRLLLDLTFTHARHPVHFTAELGNGGPPP